METLVAPVVVHESVEDWPFQLCVGLAAQSRGLARPLEAVAEVVEAARQALSLQPPASISNIRHIG